jgi:hypothetical protein
MFKSIQPLRYLGQDPKTKFHSYLYKIIDEDFEEEIAAERDVIAVGARLHLDPAAGGAIINCYSKRNLNVSKNLFLMFMFNKKAYGSRYNNIQQQISNCMKYQPLFPKYKEDVEKYLTLI